MTDQSYNGWTNYATWRVNLEIIDGMDFGSQKFKDLLDLADYLQAYTDDVLTNFGELKEPSVALDYARAFVADVYWYEIAKHYADDNEGLIADEEAA